MRCPPLAIRGMDEGRGQGERRREEIQRDLAGWGSDRAALSVGWRGEMVSGYDERLLGGLGDRWPVLPFLQVLANVDRRRVGMEFSWSGIVVSAATNIRLGG